MLLLSLIIRKDSLKLFAVLFLLAFLRFDVRVLSVDICAGMLDDKLIIWLQIKTGLPKIVWAHTLLGTT